MTATAGVFCKRDAIGGLRLPTGIVSIGVRRATSSQTYVTQGQAGQMQICVGNLYHFYRSNISKL